MMNSFEYIRTTENDKFATNKYKVRNEDGYSVGMNVYPSAAEALAHLKLLRAFEVMKTKVLSKSEGNPEDVWRVYINNACRRYVMFVSSMLAVHQQPTSFNEFSSIDRALVVDPRFIKQYDALLPPLDVVYVWYSFMQFPGRYYDTFINTWVMAFAYFPLPLKRLARAIDDFSFEYRPSPEERSRYFKFMGRLSEDPADHVFDVYEMSVFESVVSLRCPYCRQTLATDIPLTTRKRTGFSDPGFCYAKPAASKCRCPYSTITHDELRKWQLLWGLTHPSPLKGIFKHYTEVFHASKDALSIDDQIKEVANDSGVIELTNFQAMTPNQLISRMINYAKNQGDLQLAERIHKVLSVYAKTHLVYLTADKCISEIVVDLVKMCYQVEPFIDRMNKLDWLHSKYYKGIMHDARKRYTNFVSLAKKSGGFVLAPTLDIDLFWRTHQITGYFYMLLSINPLNFIFDIMEDVTEQDIPNVFEGTASLYERFTRHEYTTCYCDHCCASKFPASSSPSSHTPKRSCIMPPESSTDCGCYGQYECGGGPSVRCGALNIGDKYDME
ncbi:hypothetical protein DIURU_001629 [Diutina rugosa]|uniref:Uncharacterized protein n=1 Tax=Diutina rugosa TaxID=5481 RepID=A0A642UTJ2_DIURU|nr:uncharacterized protein DIURU_001629 [Diutina rugosa]KAA8905201.1 hypothetical protein DIURU_001629 [Diutina rugosa]